jgi:hypothetical protein
MTVKPWCRDASCSEPLDPTLVDRPDGSGLHMLCTEVVQPAVLAGPDKRPCRNPWCGGACGYDVEAHIKMHGPGILTNPDTRPQTPAAPVFATLTTAEHPLKRELVDLVRWVDSRTARSVQVAVGPSEVGAECMRRLAYRLQGTPNGNHPDPWFAIIGTAVHEWLATAVMQWHTGHGYTYEHRRYLTEERVTITDGNLTIKGSCDLYDREAARVVDHKVVGPTALKRYRDNGPSRQYRTQVHLYGLGHEQAGRLVKEVAIAFYPRSGYLDTMHVWAEPYDRQVALDALARLASIQQIADTLAPLNQWGAIPAEPDPVGCTYCPFFRPGTPVDATGCPGPNH